jgi:hypothetical protein
MESKNGLSKPNKQLTKPKTTISSVIPNLNAEVVKIYDSFQNEPRIRNITTNKELAPLIDAVGRWRFFLGLKEDPSKEEIIINVTFIREHYDALATSDIERAIQLSVAGKLDVDNECYGKFSPIYISRILNSYVEHRNKTIGEVKAKLNKLEAEKPKEVDTKQLAKDMYDLFLKIHEDANKGQLYDDFGDVWYNKIRKHGWFEISKPLAQEAFDYGKKRVNAEAAQGALRRITLGQIMSNEDRSAKAKAYARSFIVNTWLKSIKNPVDYAKKTFTKQTLIE